MEVIIKLKDTSVQKLEGVLGNRLPILSDAKGAGASDLRAPACSLSSSLKNGSGLLPLSNMTLILPHTLLDRKRCHNW